jgi:anthranilate synthase component II
MIILIDNYDSFTYNIYQYVEALGEKCLVFRNDKIGLKEILNLRPNRIIISPGPGAPESAGISLKVIEELGQYIPILGVCLGHQSIGQAFGARVVRAKRPLHGKVSEIFHDGKGIYEGLANPFKATRYHSLTIDHGTVPECLEVVAQTKDKTIMGVRHRTLPIEGVQFHPESIATIGGEKILANFLKVGA